MAGERVPSVQLIRGKEGVNPGLQAAVQTCPDSTTAPSWHDGVVAFPIPIGAVQLFGTHENVAGLNVPLLQFSDPTDDANPG